MSASEDQAPPAPTGSVVVRQLRRLVRGSWGAIRQSRLGMLGITIVIIFAAMAILAPVIAPYPRLYEAPLVDRFVINAFSHPLPPNQVYIGPVMGPTTPLQVDTGGGMWEINWNATHANVYMDYLQYSITVNPYQVKNLSVSFDATQKFNVTPLLGPPLSALYYIVPGQNLTHSLGVGDKNGALAYFMNRDFIVGDPFSDTLIYQNRLAFDPLWTGEDPASSGDLLLTPTTQGHAIVPGLPETPYGPYRYFYASDGNQTVVYEISYSHTADKYSGIQTYGHIVLWSNDTLSAPPFVYYNQNYVSYASPIDFRSGDGQAIVLPLLNNTLAVYNVTGQLRAYVPLTLDGQPASVSGPIGYARSPDLFPLRLYLPLRSSAATGLGILFLSNLTIVHELSFPNPSLQILEPPVSNKGSQLFMGFYNPAQGETFMVGMTGNLTIIPQFEVNITGRVQSYFISPDLNIVFLLTQAGKTVTLPTTFSSAAKVTPIEFGITVPNGTKSIVYAGTFHGTLYGINLFNSEIYGAFTNSATNTTNVFQLLGTTRAPLAPGTYPSGNTYWLGTDFNGHDILTQLLYGSQIAFIVGILAALFGVGIGTFVGLVSGYFGKFIDTLLMRTADIFLVLPFLPIVLILISIAKPSIWIIIFVLAILGWPGIARVIRAQVLSLKERPFVDAARVAGSSDMRLIFLHIAPNVLPFSFLYMSLGVAGAIITEAALSYLGLGDPNVTSWGGMLSNLITLGGGLYYWWWLLPPGLSITLLSLGFYLLGRGFDEIINPRLRRR